MPKQYINPSQTLGKVDDETFANVLNKHLEYLHEYQEEYATNPDVLETLLMIKINLGNFYLLNEKYDEALEYFLPELETIKQQILNGSEQYFNYLEHLKGRVVYIYNQINEQEKLLELYFEFKKVYQGFNFDNPTLGVSIIAICDLDIAQTYFNLKDYDNSEKYYLDALPVLTDKNEKVRELVGNAKIRLARIYDSRSDYNLTRSNYLEALDIYYKLSKLHPQYTDVIVNVRNEYSQFLERNKEYAEAIYEIKNNIELIKLNTNITNQQRQFLANLYFRLGNLYINTSANDEAITSALAGLEIIEDLARVDSKRYLTFVPDFRVRTAVIAKSANDFELAERMYKENIQFVGLKIDTLNSRQKRFLAEQYLSLVSLRDRQKDFASAIKYCKETLKLFEELIDEDKDEYLGWCLDVKNTLSQLYFAQGDNYNSEMLCLRLIEDVSGLPDDVTKKEFLVTVYRRLINIYTKSNYQDVLKVNYRIIIPLLEDLIANKKHKFLVELINTRHDYALLLHKTKDTKNAIENLEKNLVEIDILEIMAKEPTSALVLKQQTLHILARMYKDSNNESKAIELYDEVLPVLDQLRKTDNENFTLLKCEYTDEMANIYLTLKKYQEAEASFVYTLNTLEALEFSDPKRRQEVLGIAYFKTGRGYFLLKKYSLTKMYYEKALEMFDACNENQKFDKIIEQINKTLDSLEEYFKKLNS